MDLGNPEVSDIRSLSPYCGRDLAVQKPVARFRAVYSDHGQNHAAVTARTDGSSYKCDLLPSRGQNWEVNSTMAGCHYDAVEAAWIVGASALAAAAVFTCFL